MVLALVKELKKLDITEEKAFKLILNDFWRKNPSDDNWKKVFQEVFNITLEDFYLSLKNYTNDINSVLPSESLKLENIFPPPPPPPPKSDTSSPVVKVSGYTSSNASATSNVFVLKEVTSEFSVGDIVTFGNSKKEHEIVKVKALNKSESGNSQSIILMDGVGFVVKKGWKVSVVKETDVEEPVRIDYSNGSVYVGEIVSGKPHGQGTFTSPNGYKYEGEWKDGKPVGQGTEIFPDGSKGIGEFRDSKPWNTTHWDKNGNIIYKVVNGKTIKP